MKRKEEKHDLLIKKGYFRKTFKKAISIIILAAFICGAGQPLMIKEVKAATTSRKYGDVNWDGTVNNSDFLWVTQHISASTINDIKSKHPDWILTGDDFKAADVNTDGVIDSRDSTRINEHASASAVDSIRAKHPDWILKKTFSSSYPDDGYYTIVSAMNTSKAIDASGCNASNGTNIQLYDKNGTRAQVFYLKRKGRFYTINLIASNAMMDVAGGVTTKGTNVQLYENNGSDAQLWKFDSAGSGNYYIRSKLGHFLDVAKANQANGTNIGVWIQKNANNQKFKLLNIGNGTAMYTQASVVLRKSASEKATAIQTLSKGSQVYRYCTFGNWSMVKANGKCGYIPTKNLGKNKPTTTSSGTNIKLNKSSVSIIAGSPITLSATVYPNDATNKAVTWSSSNKNVATVSGGKVRGISAGTATIKAKISNGKTATCKVTVKFKKYSLTNTYLIKIARLCQQEQGTVKGAKAEASLMANQLETSKVWQKKYGKDGNGLYKYVRNSGWFSRAPYWMDKGKVSDSILAAVKDVLVNGNRTLPLFVDEHDDLRDIISISTGKKSNRSSYIRGNTIVKNQQGSTWVFWCFPDSNSDPFGYIKSTYKAVTGE